jgi:hypothetical protein
VGRRQAHQPHSQTTAPQPQRLSASALQNRPRKLPKHVTIATAAAIALPPLLPRTPLILLATGTAISRLLLGEHYPSDVAAGAILGAAIAAPYAR